MKDQIWKEISADAMTIIFRLFFSFLPSLQKELWLTLA